MYVIHFKRCRKTILENLNFISLLSCFFSFLHFTLVLTMSVPIPVDQKVMFAWEMFVRKSNFHYNGRTASTVLFSIIFGILAIPIFATDNVPSTFSIPNPKPTPFHIKPTCQYGIVCTSCGSTQMVNSLGK